VGVVMAATALSPPSLGATVLSSRYGARSTDCEAWISERSPSM
jgi:hypothetical protein